MNILIFANTSIGKKGNIGFRLQYIIAELQNNHHVRVFARANYTANGHIDYFPLFEFFSRGLNFIRLNIFSFSHRIYDARVFEFFSFIYYFVFCRNDSYNIALMCEYMPSFSRYLRSKGIHIILDIPITPEFHKLRPSNSFCLALCPYNPSIDNLERRAICESDKVIVPSCFSLDEISYHYPSKIIFSTAYKVNTPSNYHQSTKHRMLLLSSKRINYIFSGNLSKRKGVDALLDAWVSFASLARDKYDLNVNLYLAGKAQIDISPYMHISSIFPLGFVNVEPHLATSHFILLPSSLEGYPKSVAEGVAFGCIPIVTPQCVNFTNLEIPHILIDYPTSSTILKCLISSLSLLPTWPELSYRLYSYNNSLQPYQRQYSDIIFS